MPLMAFPAAGCPSCFPFDNIVPFPIRGNHAPKHHYSYWYSVFQDINAISFNIYSYKKEFYIHFIQNITSVPYNLFFIDNR